MELTGLIGIAGWDICIDYSSTIVMILYVLNAFERHHCAFAVGLYMKF